jgi:2-hydroxychromene-2-carboxylate isomerase|tara:strand:- start:419 stop:1060 length:642 start_codon:yes stop_codon:yes gene_type:complete
MATGFVDFYIDIKSPYAFLALEPSLNTFAELDLEINFFPYILDIADYLGSAKVDNSGKVIEENRSAHQWRRVKYSYMDCRRLANLTGKTILGTQKIWDTRLVSHLMIWAKENAKSELVPLIQYVFERFWKRELNVEKEETMEMILKEFNLDYKAFLSWKKKNGKESLDKIMGKALERGIFGVPTYVYEDEIFWGRENLSIIRGRVTGDYKNVI